MKKLLVAAAAPPRPAGRNPVPAMRPVRALAPVVAPSSMKSRWRASSTSRAPFTFSAARILTTTGRASMRVSHRSCLSRCRILCSNPFVPRGRHPQLHFSAALDVRSTGPNIGRRRIPRRVNVRITHQPTAFAGATFEQPTGLRAKQRAGSHRQTSGETRSRRRKHGHG